MRAAAELADAAYGVARARPRGAHRARGGRSQPCDQEDRAPRTLFPPIVASGPAGALRTRCRATSRSRGRARGCRHGRAAWTATARIARGRLRPALDEEALAVYELVLRAQERPGGHRAGADCRDGRRGGARDHQGGGPRRALRPRAGPRGGLEVHEGRGWPRPRRAPRGGQRRDRGARRLHPGEWASGSRTSWS